MLLIYSYMFIQIDLKGDTMLETQIWRCIFVNVKFLMILDKEMKNIIFCTI